jgi:thiol-disulfide isomerase/thioredoxin
MKKTQINTVNIKRGLTRIYTVYNFNFLWPLCSLWPKNSVAKSHFVRASKSKVGKAPVQLRVLGALLVMVGVCFPFETAGNVSIGQTERNFIEEWEKVPAAEVNILPISKEQLLTEVRRSLEVQKNLGSWEARYHATWRQHSISDSAPEFVIEEQSRIVSDKDRWFFEGKEEHDYGNSGDRQMTHSMYACNGQIVTMLWPDDKTAQLKDAQEVMRIPGETSVADFMPWLPAESCLRNNSDFPAVNEILGSPDTQLLPWYTRINGQVCYVLEQTTTLRQPIFRNKAELEKWKVENPEEANAWLKIARYGLVFIIYPQGRPGGEDTREVETKFRLAIAPKLDFAIVCWAYGYGSLSGAVQGFVFPDREIKYGDFRRVSKDLLIPHHMVYTNYRIELDGQRSVAKDNQLTIEEFKGNEKYKLDMFQLAIPEGYRVIDSDRGIIYNAGDSQERINILLAGAKARDAFYKNKKLSEGPAPSLEGARWLNSEPIQLSEQVGKEVILHFWGIGCAPCIAELPDLQREYRVSNESGPLFISIHPYVEGEYLETLKEKMREYSITFPVMVDKNVVGKPYWGKTFMKYMVDSIPTDIKIDKTGHIEFESSEKDLINDKSR